MSQTILTGRDLAFSYGKAGRRVAGQAAGQPVDGQPAVSQSTALPRATAHNAGNRAMAFENLSIDLDSSTILAVLGNNGAGKSSLLNVLCAQNQPASGELTLLGRDMSSMTRVDVSKHVAYVSQDNRPSHLSVFDQVLMGRHPHLGWAVSMHDREVAMQAIRELDLLSLAQRHLDELSGGERQKVYIARALAQTPKVLLLDEPTGALDPKNQMTVMQLIREVTNKNELATVVVMHDINLALRFADRFLLMRNGTTVAYGGPEVITKATLSATYDFPLELIDVEGARLALPTQD